MLRKTRKLDFYLLIAALLSLGCRGKAGSYFRGQAASAEQDDTAEFEGTGEPTAVSGINLLPYCDLSVTESQKYLSCELYKCKDPSLFTTCSLAVLSDLAKSTSGKWRGEVATTLSLTAGNCTASADGLSFVCRVKPGSRITLSTRNSSTGDVFTHLVPFLSETSLSVSESTLKLSWKEDPQVKSLVVFYKGASVSGSVSGNEASFTLPGLEPGSKHTLKSILSIGSQDVGSRFSAISLSKSFTVPTVTASSTPTPTPTPTSPPGGGTYTRYVLFVSSRGYTADQLNSTFANSECQDMGTTSMGTSSPPWKALLSYTGANAVDLLNQGNLKVYMRNVSGATDMGFKDTLFSSGLPASMTFYYENGGPTFTGESIWTGSSTSGTTGSNCLNWTSVSGTEFGAVGGAEGVSSIWLSNNAEVCTAGAYRIYCFQPQ